jgi:peroxiredoxin
MIVRTKIILGLATAAILLGTLALTPGDKLLKIGSTAPKPDLKMEDVSGTSFALEGLKDENGLLVVFSCNTCPFVLAWEDRYAKIAEACKEEKIGMVAINSNEAKRSGDKTDDSMEAMKKHAEEQGYQFNYLLDKDAELAIAFGATKTPQVFLFNKNLELKYTGAIDDNLKDASKVENEYLAKAIHNLANNKKIDPETTAALGCSIKKVSVKK